MALQNWRRKHFLLPPNLTLTTNCHSNCPQPHTGSAGGKKPRGGSYSRADDGVDEKKKLVPERLAGNSFHTGWSRVYTDPLAIDWRVVFIKFKPSTCLRFLISPRRDPSWEVNFDTPAPWQRGRIDFWHVATLRVSENSNISSEVLLGYHLPLWPGLVTPRCRFGIFTPIQFKWNLQRIEGLAIKVQRLLQRRSSRPAVALALKT